MATPVSCSGPHKRRAADTHDAVGAALQTQLSLIASFHRWLVQRIGADGDRDQVISNIQKRLDSYEKWIHSAEDMPDNMSYDVEPWVMDAQADQTDLVIVVTGPGMGDEVKITAKDRQELEYLMSNKYLSYMIRICHAFDQAQKALVSLLQIAEETERESSRLSQPAELTVQSHIRRLKEYNDIKDIGQQLIGLIAENRGVPIGTLYESGQYGVTADD